MKPTLLLALIVSTICSYSQIVITPEGFADKLDTSKKYIVVNVENSNKDILYKNALKYINKNYKNPEKVIKSKIESEYIRIDSYKSNISFFKSGMKHYINAEFSIELSFKDNKVKYEIVSYKMYTGENDHPFKFKRQGLSYGIYDKKGNLKFDYTKNDIETFFNLNIKVLESELKGETKDNDW